MEWKNGKWKKEKAMKTETPRKLDVKENICWFQLSISPLSDKSNIEPFLTIELQAAGGCSLQIKHLS